MRPAGGDGSAAPRPDPVPVIPAVVTVNHHGTAARITVTGEVDLSNAATVEQQILNGFTDTLASVTLDLTGLRYIDSAGLWILFRLATHLATTKIVGELLVPTDGPVRRMIDTAGVAAALPCATKTGDERIPAGSALPPASSDQT